MTLRIKQPVQANMIYKKSEDVPFPSTLVPVCTWMTSMIDCWFREMEFWDCVHSDWRRVLLGSVLIEFQTTAMKWGWTTQHSHHEWKWHATDILNVCISYMHIYSINIYISIHIYSHSFCITIKWNHAIIYVMSCHAILYMWTLWFHSLPYTSTSAQIHTVKCLLKQKLPINCGKKTKDAKQKKMHLSKIALSDNASFGSWGTGCFVLRSTMVWDHHLLPDLCWHRLTCDKNALGLVSWYRGGTLKTLTKYRRNIPLLCLLKHF